MKKKSAANIILVITLLIGIGLLLYPSISEYINSKNQSKVIESYNDAIENISEEKMKDVIAEAHRYNEKLAATKDAFYKPYLVDGYYSALDVDGTGVMGYVSIDKIKVELPIYHTVDENVLQIAAGHLPGSSLPVGGESTHAVISGHRGLPSAKLFSDLDKLEIGDTFRITVLNEIYTYQVDKITTVRPNEVEELQIKNGKDYCTLFTCTPYGINTHRLLVRGERIANIEEKKVYVANDAFYISPFIVTPIVAAPMLLVLLIVMLVNGANAKKRRERNQIKRILANDENNEFHE
ncbi:MAG: class C sortase [Ruminococcus sp.]|nr:class C sortase [Ruminococcus sp.]